MGVPAPAEPPQAAQMMIRAAVARYLDGIVSPLGSRYAAEVGVRNVPGARTAGNTGWEGLGISALNAAISVGAAHGVELGRLALPA